MTVAQLYERIGGNYEEVKNRFLTDSRIEKFAKMFLTDTSFQDLELNYKEGRFQEAFRAAHTLKGVCLNLGFEKLGRSSSAMTEALRYERLDEAKEIFSEVTMDYENTVSEIRAFTEGRN